MDMDIVRKVAKIFTKHGIYSRNRFESKSCPLNVFKNLYPSDGYTAQINTFLDCQPALHLGLGADLPWWGTRYFSGDAGIRTMILSQDSRNPNSGSVCFYMPLMKEASDPSELRKIIRDYTDWDSFVSFEKVKKFFNKCDFDYDFVYVTDAQKIDVGWEHLLEEEIQLVKPDVIVCLGNMGLRYLTNERQPKVTKIIDENYGRVALDNTVLPLMGRKPLVVAALFPSTGNGHYTTEREDQVVGTYHAVVRELESS